MYLKRNRLIYFVMIIIVICLGLLSRKMQASIPDIFDLFLGDSLWALMVFLIFGMLFSRWTIQRVVIGSVIFCFLIELSQLYHAPWIDKIRNTRIGGLVLGYGFLFTDLIAYIIGVGMGIIVDCLIRSYQIRKRSSRS